MNFSIALDLVKNGAKIKRASWVDSFVYLVPGSTFAVSRPPLEGIYPTGTQITYRDHLDIRHEDGTCGVWSQTQEDILANDWELVKSITSDTITLSQEGGAALAEALRDPAPATQELKDLMKLER